MILFGANVVSSLRARRRTLLAAALVGVLLVVAAPNLWAWYHLHEANCLVEKQQFAKAYPHCTRCLQVWRWSAATHFLAGRTARRAGLYPEAARHLDECGRLQGDASNSSLPLALEHLLLQAQSGDISEVEDALWDYVQKDKPETPLVLEALARGYVRMFRLGTALRCLRMLLDREPNHIEALMMRGWIRDSSGDPAEAIKDYRRALELDPDRDDARLSLARILVRDSPEEARTHFERLRARQPDNAEMLAGLAEAYRALGESEKARPIFEALLAKNPNDSRALGGLGALTLAGGDATESEALLRKALVADPGNVDVHWQLYLCLVQQPGREKDAAAQHDIHKRVDADFKRLAQIAGKEMTRKPNDPNLHSEMGVIYLRYGKPEIGLRWLYRALKLDPTHQPSHQALYDYYKRTGQLEKAEQHRKEIRPGTASPSPRKDHQTKPPG